MVSGGKKVWYFADGYLPEKSTVGNMEAHEALMLFNTHKASVFMGDTGSLFLGAMVAGYGILSPSPLLILIAGGVFVIEAFSVIAQVVWFKLSNGKRLFRMAPIHHHFEKLGWSENRVVGVFSLVGAVLAALALMGR